MPSQVRVISLTLNRIAGCIQERQTKCSFRAALVQPAVMGTCWKENDELCFALAAKMFCILPRDNEDIERERERER